MAEEQKTTIPEEEAQTAEEIQKEKPKKEKKAKKNAELEKLQTDYNDLKDRYMRMAAEYDNFRKRSMREREQVWGDATAKTVAEFLTVADNFDRALSVECADAEFKKGMEMTFRSLQDALKKLGIESFGEVGEEFDPALHNAVMHIDDDSLGTQVIAMVLQRGYKIGDKVLRYAMVQVAN